MQVIDRKKIPVKRLAVILGALASFGAFGTDMYLSGFPSIAKYFNTDEANVQLTLSVYFLGLAVGQLFYGPLVDRFGRRKPLIVGVAIFVVASLLITIAPNIHCFIGLRLLQALGGCSGMIVGRAVVRDLFDLQESARFMSMLAVVQGLAPIIAPVLGAYLLTVSVWQSVFWFIGALGLACLIGTAVGLPETLTEENRSRAGLAQVFRA
jgi:MFS transporter, DHA1 family, multidrug resistance protein